MWNRFADVEGEKSGNDGVGVTNRECRKPVGQASKAKAKELKQRLEDQQYCCAISGLPLTPDTAALDHIVPVSDGGTHDIENLQWLHVDVNKMKGSLSQQRFESLIVLMASSITHCHTTQHS